MASELDGAVLSRIFSLLPGQLVAVCAQVSRAWRSVASSEALWQQQCRQLEPHHHLARDDLLPEFGGSYRRYYAWRWPLLQYPVHRIVVETEQPGRQIATYPAPPPPGGGEQQPGRRVCVVEAAQGAWVQQATLSPVGGLVAFTEMGDFGGGHLEARVVVADARSGGRVTSLVLESPFPPFYYYWLPCGTRLLFLSNWETDVVALRALDLAPALLPPAAPGTPPRQQEREVLLCASRPLFLSASPTCTRLVWHGGQREVGLCDAATLTAEDGSQDDCFFANPLPCGSQAPQWVVDAAGADWLLLPIMHPQPADVEAGVLVLAPLAGVAHALEAEGSRLSPSLLLNLSHQVAPFFSSRDLFYAASPAAAVVAWCDRGELRAWFRGSGAIHQIFPMPDASRQQEPAAGRRRGGPGDAPLWRGGSVLAMQWSPDGRRLLLLVRRRGAGPLVSLSKSPQFRWVVYDTPRDPPPPAGAATPGWLGALTQCRPFNPTLEFLDRYLPFFDQYSRSMRLWGPASAAFCFASRGRPSVPEVSEEANVSVQHVPPPGQPTSAGQPGGSGAEAGGGPPAALDMLEAPAPVWLGQGNMASWSWQ